MHSDMENGEYEGKTEFGKEGIEDRRQEATSRAREMAQWSRVFTAAAEDPGLVPC